MREILFRGKRIDNGEWLEGYYGFDDNKPLIAINKANGINGYFVAAETVGQYTGLTDKNGKRIFEGDIIRINNSKEFCFEVVFENYWGAVAVNRNIKKFKYFRHPLEYNNSNKYEIIGNTHDNPELFGKSEQLEVTT